MTAYKCPRCDWTTLVSDDQSATPRCDMCNGRLARADAISSQDTDASPDTRATRPNPFYRKGEG